jgi:hypothetical protein
MMGVLEISIESELELMTVAEKMKLLETVWQSLCSNPAELDSPAWHGEVLKKRNQRIEQGQSKISPWSEAKARLLNLGE